MSTRSRVLILSLALPIALLTGCDSGPKSSYGFTLPDGDIKAGEAVFMARNCNACHNVAGMPELREGVEPVLTVTLGGETTRIKTYGELVTGIINPSHKLAVGYNHDAVSDEGVSKMPSYNDTLTVTELIDLVAFLQGQYELITPSPTTYPPYTFE